MKCRRRSSTRTWLVLLLFIIFSAAYYIVGLQPGSKWKRNDAISELDYVKEEDYASADQKLERREEEGALIDEADRNNDHELGVAATTTKIYKCTSDVRLKTLRSECELLKDMDTTWKRLGQYFLYVNDRYKYVACLPPKTASTTWKIILVNNSIDEPVPADFNGNYLHDDGLLKYGFRSFSSYSAKEQKRIREHYFKFAVVRHPLDRLYSAYLSKIVKYDYHNTRQKILAIQRQKAPRHGDHQGTRSNRGTSGNSSGDIDFAAFLDFVVRTPQRHDDGHWSPVTVLCDACGIHYDKILKLETQADDLLDVLPHLGPYKRGSQAHANSAGRGGAQRRSWHLPEYANVSQAIVSQLMSMGFENDLNLFGYSWSQTLSVSGITATCSSNKNNCC